MRNKATRIVFVAILGAAVLYGLRSWRQYEDRISFDRVDVPLEQTKVDLASVQSTFQEPIWHVKSESPVTCFSIKFKNEGDRSFKDSPSILSVLVPTLMEGAGEYDAIDLKRQMLNHSISISILQDFDDIVVTVTCLEKYVDKAADLLCMILSKAHLKAEKIEVAKQGCIAAMKQSMFSTMSLAREKCTQLMYPEGHPYRVSYAEDLAKIPTYTREDIVKCYSSLFAAADAEITIVSGLTGERITEIFDKIHGAIRERKNDFKGVDVQETRLHSPGRVEHVELDNPQTAIMFAMPGIQKKSKEIFAAIAAVELFGKPGTITTRLASEVRGEGYVYRIKAAISANSDMCSHIIGECNTRPENVQDVIDLIKNGSAKMFKDGITEEELDQFKHCKFAEFIPDSSPSTLGFVMMARAFGIKLDAVNDALRNFAELTVESVNAVIKKMFDPSNIIIVDCGKSTKAPAAIQAKKPTKATPAVTSPGNGVSVNLADKPDAAKPEETKAQPPDAEKPAPDAQKPDEEPQVTKREDKPVDEKGGTAE
jgi:predicted Zn-dependent peptidase